MKRLIALVLLCVVPPACATRTGAGAKPAGLAAPVAAVSPIAEASVRAHMEFLAGDALNGRGSGTRDEWIAATYAAAQMRRLGLEPLGDAGGFVQTVSMDQVELTTAPILRIGRHAFTHGKEIVVSTSAARVSGRLQKWKPGAPVHPGTAIVMPDPAPANTPSFRGAIVLSPQTPDILKWWRFLSSRPARVSEQLVGIAEPAGSIVFLEPKAYAVLAAAADGETVILEADSKPAVQAQTWNAVGRLPGSDAAAPVILLSAHLDHLGNRADRPGASGDTIFNGADDDASGSVAVLELMEALTTGPRPKRTIVFALFGSEETGGSGSRFFAEKPVVPLDRVAANLQVEMIGRPDGKVPPHTLWLTGFERSTLGPELVKRGAKLVQDPYPDQNFFERSDSIQFARRGVVAHTISSYGLHTEYHTPADELSRIDFAHLTDAIRSMLETVRWLANTDFVPTWIPGKKP